MIGDDDFDRVFGSHPNSKFTERLGRAEPLGDSALKAVLVGTGPYKPFGHLPTNTVGESCDVRRWVDGTDQAEGIEFPYRLLMQVAYVGEEQMRLYLPDTIVLIEGVKLGELRQKLARRQATFIQQFSARIWPRPGQSQTVVERVEILRPQPLGRTT